MSKQDSIHENSLFDPSDFESIRIAVRIKNLSTDAVVEDDEQISVIEVGDNALTLAIPGFSCAVDNHLMVEIYRDDAQIFNATAKVVSAIDAGDGTLNLSLKLIQFDKKSWSDFLKIFSKRQDEISQFFAMGKK